MMAGSIFYNCWAALIGFTIYFLANFRYGNPTKIIISSFIVAAISFIAMYLFRFLIGYIISTPKEEKPIKAKVEDEQPSNKENENPEEIAKVIREMLNDETK